MAAYGVPELAVARVLAVDPKTLRKHYRDELDTGQIKATAKVAESLFRKATSDGAQSVTAAIFWLKTRGGWREAPQDHRVNVGVRSMSEFTDQELMQMIGIVDTTVTRKDAAQKARQIIEVNARPSGSLAPAARAGDGSGQLR